MGWEEARCDDVKAQRAAAGAWPGRWGREEARRETSERSAAGRGQGGGDGRRRAVMTSRRSAQRRGVVGVGTAQSRRSSGLTRK